LHDAPALAAVARLIAAQMRRDDAPARFIIDNNPLNFRFLHLIHTLFPSAQIIHCRRGARDAALSIWQQHFAHPDLAFSYHFDAIAQFMDGYRALMQHWHATLPLRCLEVDYEMFVADPQHEIHRMTEFLRLTSAPANAVTKSGAITTASVWQARQPVHTHSQGRWRNYAVDLPELARLFAA